MFLNFIKLCILNANNNIKKRKNRKKILEIIGSSDWSVKKKTHTHTYTRCNNANRVEKKNCKQVLRLRCVNR